MRNSIATLLTVVSLISFGCAAPSANDAGITTQVQSKLAADSDWYDQEITLENTAGFQVGDGICLRARGCT